MHKSVRDLAAVAYILFRGLTHKVQLEDSFKGVISQETGDSSVSEHR